MRRPGTGCLVGPTVSAAWYRDPVLLGIMALNGVLSLWFLLDSDGGWAPTLVCWTAVVVLDSVLGVAAHRVLRLLAKDDPARRFWYTVRAASLLYAAGFVVQMVSTLTDPGATESLLGGWVSSAALALGSGAITVVMLGYPLGISSARERACFWLDLATVTAGGAAFGWYFAMPKSGFDSSDVLGSVLAILQGPVVLLVAGFAVAKLMIAGTAPFSRAAGILAALTGLVAAAGRGLAPALVGTDYAGIFLVLTLMGHTLAPIGVRLHERHLLSRPRPAGVVRKRPYSPVPYVAIAATYGLLIVVLALDDLSLRTWGVLAGAVLSTALVVVRQLAAFAENARLLVQLRTALGERDALEVELRRQAYHDSLTGLPNRVAFAERLAAEYARSRRHGWPVVVMLVDLDDFKPVNDTFGHHAGDLLLQEVACRLRASVRDVDAVARFGGDEFAIVLAQPYSGSVEAMAERVLADLGEPFLLQGEQRLITGSVGIALDPDGRGGPDQLLRDADAAMYLAKRRGKSCFAVFTPTSLQPADF